MGRRHTKKGRNGANAVAVVLVPFPHGALRMKQTGRMQIKARLVDPPVDTHPADNLVKDK